MKRRQLIVGAGAVGLVGTAAKAGTKSAGAARLAAKAPAKFVLVHGAFHGGWCYADTARILRSAGHEVWTPSLSGLGEHAGNYSPAINLSTHIADIVRLIDIEGISDAILCGHSYAGMVVTGVADKRPSAFRSIVYLDAFLPEDGQSLFDLDSPTAVTAHLKHAGENGGHSVSPVPSAVFGVAPENQARVDRNCTVQPLATFNEQIKLAGDHKKVGKKMYIYATGWEEYTPFKPAYEKAKADPGFVTHTVPCGHDVMVDMPERLAELLVEAA